MLHAFLLSKHTLLSLLAAAVVAAGATMAAPVAHAAVPGTMVVEGFLHSTGGGAVADGPYSITFAIYNVKTDGSAAWTEGAKVVTVKGGQFTHVLGSTKALTAATLDQLVQQGVRERLAHFQATSEAGV